MKKDKRKWAASLTTPPTTGGSTLPLYTFNLKNYPALLTNKKDKRKTMRNY
jgi:hypothetical protein